MLLYLLISQNGGQAEPNRVPLGSDLVIIIVLELH